MSFSLSKLNPLNALESASNAVSSGIDAVSDFGSNAFRSGMLGTGPTGPSSTGVLDRLSSAFSSDGGKTPSSADWDPVTVTMDQARASKAGLPDGNLKGPYRVGMDRPADKNALNDPHADTRGRRADRRASLGIPSNTAAASYEQLAHRVHMGLGSEHDAQMLEAYRQNNKGTTWADAIEGRYSEDTRAADRLQYMDESVQFALSGIFDG